MKMQNRKYILKIKGYKRKYKCESGGLLIHKASHHFDILNWFADSIPDTLTALGSTKFYGKKDKVNYKY